MKQSVQDANLLLAKEKRDREHFQRLAESHQEDVELRYTLTNDFMTENPATEVSMLAPHRVKRYHFKGLNDDQKNAILHERE